MHRESYVPLKGSPAQQQQQPHPQRQAQYQAPPSSQRTNRHADPSAFDTHSLGRLPPIDDDDEDEFSRDDRSSGSSASGGEEDPERTLVKGLESESDGEDDWDEDDVTRVFGGDGGMHSEEDEMLTKEDEDKRDEQMIGTLELELMEKQKQLREKTNLAVQPHAKSLHQTTLTAAQIADSYQASASKLETATDQFIVDLEKGSSELQVTYNAFCSRKEVLVARLELEMADADAKRLALLSGTEDLGLNKLADLESLLADANGAMASFEKRAKTVASPEAHQKEINKMVKAVMTK